MSEFNEHINPIPHGQGDPNWQRLFDEASEMPPPRVWDAIERNLDREEEEQVIIVPFWGWYSTWRWSAAAAVALMLLGWWSLNIPAANPVSQVTPMASKQTSSEINSDLARNQTNESNALSRKPTKASQAITPENTDQLAQHRPIEPSKSTARTSERLAANGSAVRLSGADNREQLSLAQPELTSQPKVASVLQPEPPMNSSNQYIDDKPAQNTKPVSGEAIAGVSSSQSVTPKTVSGQPSIDGQIPEIVSSDIATANASSEMTVANLATRPVQLPAMHGTQRIVWFRPTETPIAPAELSAQKAGSEHWASVSVMPSSYNPLVSLQQATVMYSNAFAQNSTANPTLKSQADLSMAYQLSGGIQLSSRWSVETGVGYLEARSTVNSPVQTIVSSLFPSNRLSNLYADVLNNSRVSDKQNSFLSNASLSVTPSKLGSPSASDPLINTNLYDIGRSQVLSNDYTFVQVPVQLGYQIRPRKRLGFTVLGGFLTNLFIHNNVNNQLSITNSDMVYRPVTLSASTGLRFRYRPTRRWSASMAGIFQQALQRGTRAGTDLTTRPQTIGVSVGLDYHF